MPPVKKHPRERRPTFIKSWREFRGFTQDKLAEKLRITQGTYARIEAGKIPYNQDFLEQCAEALNCSTTDLLSVDPATRDEIDRLTSVLSQATPEDQARIIAVAKTLLKS